MSSIVHLDSPRRTRWPSASALVAGAGLVLALTQAVPAAAQKAGAPPPDPEGCTLPFASRLPGELRPFVLPGTRMLCAAAADLNADGLGDYVLVLEKVNQRDTVSIWSDAPRPLLVVVRQPGGSLHLAGRNDRVVYCAGCGGVFGDPFEGVEVGTGTFTVYHYGGSAWRWRADYTFRYAQGAGTWRLAKVVEMSHHTLDAGKLERTLFVAPDDFEEIDLADFHPESWKRPSAGP